RVVCRHAAGEVPAAIAANSYRNFAARETSVCGGRATESADHAHAGALLALVEACDQRAGRRVSALQRRHLYGVALHARARLLHEALVAALFAAAAVAELGAQL